MITHLRTGDDYFLELFSKGLVSKNKNPENLFKKPIF
jgi:hypothetical protein